MVQTRKQLWIEIVFVVLTLAAAGMMLYALLPFITAPDQQLVPPPPPMDVQQTLLTLFIAATAIGAPLTVGIVLWLVARPISKRLPASSSVAPEIPSPQPKARPAEGLKEMSPREATMWKIIATVLLLIIGVGALVLLASAFAQFYPG
ncbi:MAG TPA: hypothetical protein VMP08_24305 [Anaerolineae bacterium]|nr:hypothetical protein [Anaerolineae bacterium]